MEEKNLVCLKISQEQRELYRLYNLKPQPVLSVMNNLFLNVLRETEFELEALEEIDEVMITEELVKKAKELKVERKEIEARSRHSLSVMLNGSEAKSKT